jgi:uncharacterized protein (TIGR00369 family)
MTEASLETARSVVDAHGYLSWLGLDIDALEDGRVVLSIPARDELRNVGGPVHPIHGGVVATLVDTASGFALRTTFEDPAAARLTTTDLDVSYLRPALGDLRATASVVRAGGSMGVVDVTVESEDGTPQGEGETGVAGVNRDGDAEAGVNRDGYDEAGVNRDSDAEAGINRDSDAEAEDGPVAVGRATYRLYRGDV